MSQIAGLVLILAGIASMAVMAEIVSWAIDRDQKK